MTSPSPRIHQAILIATFIPLCWFLMQAVHELGHVSAAWATGGKVAKVVLHPLTISRTDSVGSRHPAAVSWAGPLVGAALPLVLLAIFKAARWKWDYLVQFFAGTCLIANGAYLGIGSFAGIGDAGDLLRHATPRWCLWLFGLLTVPPGFLLWNGLGAKFGLGWAAGAAGQVDRRAAYASAAMLAVVVAVECAFSSVQ